MEELNVQMSNIDRSDQYSKNILKNIKHDLINPINAMIGYSELILDELGDMEEIVIENDIRCIHQSSSDILAILQNIFSKNIENADDDIIHVISDEKLHYSVRTPLSSVIGLSELILEDTLTMSVEEMKDIRESITKINHSGASEYEIYFNYMLKNHNDKIIIRKLNWKNCSNLDINSKYDYISYHWHKRK